MWDRNIKLKQFRDPVHGYISVPSNYCEKLIDTELFQRLRGIEQTSMRPLYPAARHDRFIHSLGVYHLACLAFHFIKKNTSPTILGKVDLNDYKDTFLIAALMHDCGHAPFSHLFEGYYNSQGKTRKLLLEEAGSDFEADYKNNCDDHNGAFSGAPHEEFSAYLLIKHFSETTLDFDPILAARMITGCIHNMPGNDKRKNIENCLIKLINGDTIDVDKLDYIMRDTWASGVNNVTIDVHRLLTALELVDTPRFGMVYNKSALSVIQNVIDGRNFLYRWIYTHHTVLYNNHLLKKSLEVIKDRVDNDCNGKTLLDKIFSPEAFEDIVDHNNYHFYLPCDGDIYYLMKKFSDIPEVKEITSRCPKKIPLWKTYAEFKSHFTGQMGRIPHLRNKSTEYLSNYSNRPKEDFLVLPVKAKYVEIEEDQLLIKLSHDNSISYEKAMDNENSSSAVEYFYVYIPADLKDKKMEYINVLKNA